MKLVELKDIISKGGTVIYSDMYDKSYATLKPIRITNSQPNKRRPDIFLFEAEMIDNSTLDSVKEGNVYDFQKNGSLKSWNNCFIYKDLADLRRGSEAYKQVQIKFLQRLSPTK